LSESEHNTRSVTHAACVPSDQRARATVQVAALNDGAHVELQMIAVQP
jgi:enamine deaminase RidA (YjgF/YER057c/UK114 family)